MSTITNVSQISDGDIAVIGIKHGKVAKLMHLLTRSKFDTAVYFVTLEGQLYAVKKDWYGIVVRPFTHYLNDKKYHMIIGTPISTGAKLDAIQVLQYTIRCIGYHPFENFMNFYGSSRMIACLYRKAISSLSNYKKVYPWTLAASTDFTFSDIKL